MAIGNQHPFISVCIPAYKHGEYIHRLMTTLSQQTFTDFEIIVTDDSPDDSVKDVILEFYDHLNVKYLRNIPALGTP
ncbi:MAG: glycosyltransferase, partial [Sphingobacteriales bacterium]